MDPSLSATNAMQAQAAMMSAKQLPKPVANGNIAQMRETAQEFEATFLSQMLQPMFANLGAEKPFGGGSGEDMWRSMQVEEYGKAIAQKGGIGVADQVFREMLKLQEVK
jgi:peptidoglycan hydrolase FlgJ